MWERHPRKSRVYVSCPRSAERGGGLETLGKKTIQIGCRITQQGEKEGCGSFLFCQHQLGLGKKFVWTDVLCAWSPVIILLPAAVNTYCRATLEFC
jgi:hypothetical protein